MQSGFIRAALGAAARLVFGVATLGLSCGLLAQEPNMAPRAAGSVPSSAIPAVQSSAIPDAPTPQIDIAAIDPQSAPSQTAQQPATGSAPSPDSSTAPTQNSNSQNANSQSTSNAQSTSFSPQQSSSNTQPSTTQSTGAQKTQQQKAAEQIKAQEHQRIGGILPSFNVTYLSNAASMTAGQKIGLAFRSSVDPYAFGLAFFVAGISEAKDDDTGFGWGPEGYFKRAGAAYLDAFDGAMIGNGFLPALLHQDPRYFRLGHGTFKHRFLYAIATSVICKHDNTGKWEPNYSNVGGNIIAGAISNLYYPSNTAGWGQTINNGLIVTGEGTFGGVLQEFWPDISRKLFHKDPTHGLDAQSRAADLAAKQKKQQEQNPK
jgi:hypothetical protein